MPETTDTPRPPTERTDLPPPSAPPPSDGSTLLGILLVGSGCAAGFVAFLGRAVSCGGVQLGYSTEGPPTAGELSATATMFVVALVLGLAVPAIGVVRARRRGRTVAGWATLGVVPVILAALTLPPIVHASMTQRPSQYCVDPGYHGG